MHGLVSSFFISTTAITSQLVPLALVSPHQQSVFLAHKYNLTKCKSNHYVPPLPFLLQEKAPNHQQHSGTWQPGPTDLCSPAAHPFPSRILSSGYNKLLFPKHNTSFLNLEFCLHSLPKMLSPAFSTRKNPAHFSRPRLHVTSPGEPSPRPNQARPLWAQNTLSIVVISHSWGILQIGLCSQILAGG